MKIFLSLLLIFNLVIPYAMAGTEVSKYEIPDVKDAFCGVEINYQYCKCAFHDEYCVDVGLKPGSANSYILQEFRDWNKERIQKVAEQCIKRDGYWSQSRWECTYCTEGDVLDGKKCVEAEKVSEESEATKECKAALENFDNEWEKYSDFDDRLGGDVSWEVQQFNKELDDIAELVGLAHEIEYEMAIMTEVRLEMRAYKTALVQNIKVNLLKSFWRLSYVTYTTIKGALGTYGSLEKILSPESVSEGIGATLKVIQASIPPHEKGLQINTASTTGKVKSIAWNATLEIIESVGDPTDIAKQFMKDVRGAVIPSANISEAEVAILRDQHLSSKAIDEALADSYAESAALRVTLLETKKLITEKYNLMQEWKVKEYQRVKGNLENQCKDRNN